MRGSPPRCILLPSPPGIIPAHAGLTHSPSGDQLLAGDHPRACGAHVLRLVDAGKIPGSSPRMRGSRCVIVVGIPVVGIIPAHAGLTVVPVLENAVDGDHPRACGAHRTCERSLTPCPGSSPRMRGSRTQLEAADGEEGIIPAHAGLTDCGSPRRAAARDHPRACGAHYIL